MTLNIREPQVGDGVVLPEPRSAERVNSYTYDDLPSGTQFVITRVYSQRVQVRTIERFSDGDGGRRARSYTFDRSLLNYDDSAVVTTGSGTPRRRLGQKPQDTEDMQFIGIDHPGIQWLFEDMGTYATNQGWCPQYDALVARLGIPGRPRPFTVTRDINGITITTTVAARSQAEANNIVDRALNPQPTEGPSPDSPDPEPAPSDPRFPIAA